jgi:endoplasmic reticulum protein 29
LPTALIVAASLPQVAVATASGALKLDNFTLDKIVAVPGYSLMAKIDKSYAYGEKEDAFKELCKVAAPVKNFFIAEVPVQEYNDMENKDIADRYGIKSEDFPGYLLFKGSKENPVKFAGFPDPTSKKPATWDDDEDGEWEAPMIDYPSTENLITWLTINGIRVPSKGTIPELNEVAKAFMTGGFSASELEKAKTMATGQFLYDPQAPIYPKIMEKVKEKGADYLEKELARVTKIMTGKLTEEKEAQLKAKVNILKVFIADK